MKNQIVVAGKYSYAESNLLWEHPLLKVYKGYDKAAKKDVHVRVLSSDDELEPIFKVLLELKQIKHTFLTPVLEVSRPERERIIMVTETGRVCSLSEALHRSEYLLEEDALVLFKYALLALQEVHDKGGMFGYVHPENIELCTYGMVRLAYNLFTDDKKWIAPEIIEGNNRTQASDVYALGLLLYKLLYGRNPFDGGDEDSLVKDIKRRNYNKPKSASPFGVLVSKETTFLMESMLDYYPENRPALSSVLQTLSIQAIPLETDPLFFVKPKTSLMPELLQKKYIVYRASKRQLNHFYFTEQTYLCLRTDTKEFASLITPELKMYESEGRRIDGYIDKLKMCTVELSVETDSIVRVLDSERFKHEMVILSEYCNQGNLEQYLEKRRNLQGWLKQEHANLLAYLLALGIRQVNQLGVETLNSLCLSRVNLACGRVKVREPSMISNLVEKKLKQQYERRDYYAPEFKLLSGMNDIARSDIWSFGMIYYFCLTGELPQFDESQKPVMTALKVGNGNKTVIRKCLEVDPVNRIKLAKIAIEDFDKETLRVILDEKKIKNTTEEEEELYAEAHRAAEMEEEGELPPPRVVRQKQRSKYFTAPPRNIFKNYNRTLEESETKTCRIVVKSFMVIALLMVLFFGRFVNNAGIKILTSGFHKQVTLAVPKNYGTQLYNLTILSANGSQINEKYGNYSYEQFKVTLRCFENRYDVTAEDTVDNFVNGGALSTLCVAGFVWIILVCLYKVLQLCRLDLPFAMLRYQTIKDNRWSALMAWFLSEAFMVNLMFGHFYVFYWMYVVQREPCLGIENLAYPRFTSLYLLLTGQTSKYFTQVFLTVVLLCIIQFVANFLMVVFTRLTENAMRWKLYIPWLLLWLLFFVLCRVGFGGPSPLEPSYTYKFNWDIVTPYYGFIGLFPEVVLLCIWAIEMLVDLVFFLFLRRGIKVEDLDEDEPQPQPSPMSSPAVKPETLPAKPSTSYNLLLKKEFEDSLEFY